jgi:ADP-ribose pyrophosphatase YjhB (NUDIX family)
MADDKIWLDWAIELQSLAQAGMAYSKDVYDLERFKLIREISAEMMSRQTGMDLKVVTDLFCNETGFQTLKLDCRAAVFKDGKILLVKETIDQKWSMPGGWVDVNQSVRSNVIKEVKEEAGLDVSAERIIALQDRNKHNIPLYAYGICKIFVLCHDLGGEYQPNIETSASGFFSLDHLPELSLGRTTPEQVAMCFEAAKNESWQVLFD